MNFHHIASLGAIALGLLVACGDDQTAAGVGGAGGDGGAAPGTSSGGDAGGDACASNPCMNGGTCTEGDGAFTCACIDGFTGATCEALPTSCSAIKAASPALPDGAYVVDPDNQGGRAAFSVYCDQTTDGGGWTKILQIHDVAYAPTAEASGDVTTATIPAFAKLSDASINALGDALGADRVYRIAGPISPTGQKLFIFSTRTFTDTSIGFGLMSEGLAVCQTASFESCVESLVDAGSIDSFGWGLVPNDAERYYADHPVYDGINCDTPFAEGMRCFNAGESIDYAFIPDLSIWLK